MACNVKTCNLPASKSMRSKYCSKENAPQHHKRRTRHTPLPYTGTCNTGQGKLGSSTETLAQCFLLVPVDEEADTPCIVFFFTCFPRLYIMQVEQVHKTQAGLDESISESTLCTPSPNIVNLLYMQVRVV